LSCSRRPTEAGHSLKKTLRVWDLILEYMVAAVLVSTGWSAYLVNLLSNLGLQLPHALCASPWDKVPGMINLPAVFIVGVLTLLLMRGVKESSRVNLIIVTVKIVVILFFIVLSVNYIKPINWKPFMPFGFGSVMTSAAIVFLAYVGFDAVLTAAEESVNPQRDMPIGIIVSLVVATILYISVSAIMTGIVPYAKLDVADPITSYSMSWGSLGPP
jgi:basic amino acid/polyamine antiporter, APA family